MVAVVGVKPANTSKHEIKVRKVSLIFMFCLISVRVILFRREFTFLEARMEREN